MIILKKLDSFFVKSTAASRMTIASVSPDLSTNFKIMKIRKLCTLN